MAWRERGISIVEAVVGLALLAGVVLTLAGLIVSARTLSVSARDQTIAVWLARAKLAQLDALTFAVRRLPSGVVIFQTDAVTDLSREPHGLGGPGLTSSPADALARDTPGYVDHLDADGRWLPPERQREAAWVRRWAVARIGTGAAELVTYEVLVARTTVAARVAGEQLAAHPGVARLHGARARRAS